MGKVLDNLASLWVGEHLSYVEQLCITSALSLGHPFTLYSYTPETLTGVPPGTDLRDAREIFPEEKVVRYADTNSVQLGANFFRYALVAKRACYWVDLDFYFVSPLDFEDEYVFGREYEGTINNAVIKAPSNSQFVRDLCELPRTNRKPAWFGPRRSAVYYWQRLTKGTLRTQDLPWGTYGPQMVTYAAKKNGLADRAKHPSVFYPLSWQQPLAIFEPAEVVNALLTEETKAVHLWHSRIVHRLGEPPPTGSFLDKACKRHGIDTSSRRSAPLRGRLVDAITT